MKVGPGTKCNSQKFEKKLETGLMPQKKTVEEYEKNLIFRLQDLNLSPETPFYGQKRFQNLL